MKTQKTVLQKIGFPKRVDRLTKSICKQRIKILKKGIESGKYDRSPEKLHFAKYYLAKYKWLLNSDRLSNTAA